MIVWIKGNAIYLCAPAGERHTIHEVLVSHTNVSGQDFKKMDAMGDKHVSPMTASALN
jgi:hypothetical protein